MHITEVENNVFDTRFRIRFKIIISLSYFLFIDQAFGHETLSIHHHPRARHGSAWIIESFHMLACSRSWHRFHYASARLLLGSRLENRSLSHAVWSFFRSLRMSFESRTRSFLLRLCCAVDIYMCRLISQTLIRHWSWCSCECVGAKKEDWEVGNHFLKRFATSAGRWKLIDFEIPGSAEELIIEKTNHKPRYRG